MLGVGGCNYDASTTKLFRFRWNWDNTKKVARHPSVAFLLHSSVGGGGQDFLDTVIAVKML
jgi:hypothetical protein